MDPHKEIIEALLEAYLWLTAQRLYEGCAGGGICGQLLQRAGRGAQGRDAGASRCAGAVRDASGRQGPVDFGCFRLPWGQHQPLLVVLGHDNESNAIRMTRALARRQSDVTVSLV